MMRERNDVSDVTVDVDVAVAVAVAVAMLLADDVTLVRVLTSSSYKGFKSGNVGFDFPDPFCVVTERTLI
jgi:hypothetical protein